MMNLTQNMYSILKRENNEVCINNCNIICISKWPKQNAHYEKIWYVIYATFMQCGNKNDKVLFVDWNRIISQL